MPLPTLRQVADTFRLARGLSALLAPHAILASAIVNEQNEVAFYADKDGNLVDSHGVSALRGNARSWKEDFQALNTTDQISVILPSGLVASGATGVLHHIYTPGGNILGWCPLGAGQTLRPTIIADGLDVGCDQTSTEGSEVFSNFLGTTGRPFIIGKDRAFYFRCKIKVADISGLTSMAIGFRRAGVNASALATYLDYAALGLNASASPTAIKQLTGLNDTDVATDTTQTLADTIAYQAEVNVSAAGVVTFRHDAATPGVLAAPTTVAAFTFDTGDPVIPFFFALQGSDLADNVVIQSWEVGYQASAQRS